MSKGIVKKKSTANVKGGRYHWYLQQTYIHINTQTRLSRIEIDGEVGG